MIMADESFPILTPSTVIALNKIIEAVYWENPVTRFVPDTTYVVSGTARSIVDQQGAPAGQGLDIRGCFLRVTTDSGTEVVWPIATLARELREGGFAIRQARTGTPR